MVWYGMVWYGMVWYGMVWTAHFYFPLSSLLLSELPSNLFTKKD
jgi:hypothetical protein